MDLVVTCEELKNCCGGFLWWLSMPETVVVAVAAEDSLKITAWQRLNRPEYSDVASQETVYLTGKIGRGQDLLRLLHRCFRES